MIIPGKRTPPADVSKEVTDNYIKAVNLNYRIIASAQLAQRSLYEMCIAFKEMRDSKLYKELGYKSFEEYCEKETGFERRQVYRYISICENLPEDFVTPVSQIGMRKLYLLSQLSEPERAEIASNTDLESASVRELEQQVKKLRSDLEWAKTDAMNIEMNYNKEKELRLKANKETSQLRAKVKELENRPIDVAVQTVEVIPDDYITKSAYEQTVNDYIEQLRHADSEFITEKRRAYNEKVELENQLAELQKQLEDAETNRLDTEGVFKAYYANAKHALNALVIYVLDHPEYTGETKNLINEFEKNMEATI